jgi:hypothetical protein
MPWWAWLVLAWCVVALLAAIYFAAALGSLSAGTGLDEGRPNGATGRGGREPTRQPERPDR